MTKNISALFLFATLFSIYTASAQQQDKIHINFDTNKVYQTIENFAASDAWAGQFVGNWPPDKKNAIADWLFSMDTLSNGNPKGIGLSMWRYNLGAGSAEQGNNSGIKDEWRRASLTLSNSEKVQAQNWFLKAAKKRGVQQFLGFFNSPPVQLTKNGKAFSDSGRSNISSSNYKAFADYTVSAIKGIEKVTGITFNYLSPVNEPQWDWSDGGQEGCPYNNTEMSQLIKALNAAFEKNKLPTKLLITEAGELKYLFTAGDKKEKDNQINDFFGYTSPLYVGNLKTVAKTVAAHSYFTTSPFTKAMALRQRVRDSISQIKDLSFWQSEYCILGDNEGEIKGNKKDLGMDAALYIAKVIHEDLIGANATAWQWWTAISAYDYKDGLVYVEKNENDGAYSDSKMLWALGNYSRFIRPGMKRIAISMPAVKDMYLCAFKDFNKDQVICVAVNESNESKALSIQPLQSTKGFKKVIYYTTDASENLVKHLSSGNQLTLPAKSVVTIVL